LKQTTSTIDSSDLPFAELRDIMSPPDACESGPDTHGCDSSWSGDVLDFGRDISQTRSDTRGVPEIDEDQSIFQSRRICAKEDSRSAHRSRNISPIPGNGLTMSAQAFKESLWKFEPQEGDHGKIHQYSFSIPLEDLVWTTACLETELPFPGLIQITRDRVLATVLLLAILLC